MSQNYPSFPEAVGTAVSSAQEGSATVSLLPQERYLKPSGAVHGGVIVPLIDAAMAEALITITEEGEQPFTIQITVNT